MLYLFANKMRDDAYIIKQAKKRKPYFLPVSSKEGVVRGHMQISIKKFGRVGLLIDVDGGTFDFTEKQQDVLKKYLEYVSGNIEAKGFKEKLRISKSFATIAVYQGDENDVLPNILDILEGKIA